MTSGRGARSVKMQSGISPKAIALLEITMRDTCDFGIIAMAENRSQFLRRIGQPTGGEGRALKYRPDYPTRVIEMGREGRFPEEWANELCVSLETFRLWGRSYPTFRDALVLAHQQLLAHWTKRLVDDLQNGSARTGLYALLLRRFPAVYGRDPVDLMGWLLQEEEPPPAGAFEHLSDKELEGHLNVLLKRRDEFYSD